jgi:hypothetical protein
MHHCNLLPVRSWRHVFAADTVVSSHHVFLGFCIRFDFFVAVRWAGESRAHGVCEAVTGEHCVVKGEDEEYDHHAL